MKTYVGTRLPDDLGNLDTASGTIVLVVNRFADPIDSANLTEPPTKLRHVCGEPIRGAARRKTYPCHSPSGFNWGYGGSGPAELAVMILLDLGLDDAVAWKRHQRFKANFIAMLGDTWAIHEEQIREWMKQYGPDPDGDELR